MCFHGGVRVTHNDNLFICFQSVMLYGFRITAVCPDNLQGRTVVEGIIADMVHSRGNGNRCHMLLSVQSILLNTGYGFGDFVFAHPLILGHTKQCGTVCIEQHAVQGGIIGSHYILIALRIYHDNILETCHIGTIRHIGCRYRHIKGGKLSAAT